MTRRRAKNIAARHIRDCNPRYWDGTGNKKPGFDSKFTTVKLDARTLLKIHYELSPGVGWMTRYIITDAVTGETVLSVYNEAINDADRMAVCIQSVCEDAARCASGESHVRNQHDKA